ncbi:Very-long-chain 3-oxoacyl-CoA reductase [Pseudolycoriella hygida]|uniref:Very-long-chain 3-oxoacyl-CoA reductase n=1 Tax=Pseudolycoriella hygida TaxID=35572 RepID=A0A9Q0S0W8_9DIPT|nr:Very-long-chain 3-oxoacyl-CoA reductase [Pseudolycoriella hygida]
MGLLAERGFNVILVSRTLAKLQDVAKEISKSFNVQTKVVAVDFTSSSEIYGQIKQQIAGIEVGILINNVGMFYEFPESFLDIPEREKLIQDMIRCNITTVPMMCSLILPQMVQRKRGLIINISSIASVIPGPKMAIYSASKAFVTKFSEDLAAEYQSHGVDIQVMITGGVGTNMSQMEGGVFGMPTARQYVESTLRYVGYSRKTTGFFAHSFLLLTTYLMMFITPSDPEDNELEQDGKDGKPEYVSDWLEDTRNKNIAGNLGAASQESDVLKLLGFETVDDETRNKG